MEEKLILDMLTQDSVSIKKQNITTINGVGYAIGEPWRRAYINSEEGRKEVQSEVVEPYISAILAMWGNVPTVTEQTETTTS